jgi:hypothetical protein
VAALGPVEKPFRPSRSPAHKINPPMVADRVFDILRDAPAAGARPGGDVGTKVDVRGTLARTKK